MFRVLTCLTAAHDWHLVILAGFVCLLASGAAVGLFQRALAARDHARDVWTATAAVAIGGGVWAAHFIFLLGYNTGVTVGFDIGLTAASLLVAIIVSALGFWVAVIGTSVWSAPLGGGIVGLGIVAMHYLGTSAVRVSGEVHWAMDLVIGASVVAIVFAAAALFLAARAEHRQSLAAAVLLSLAIILYHFIAMGAVSIVPDIARPIGPFSLSATALAITIVGATLAIIVMCFVVGMGSRRTETTLYSQNVLLNAALNNMNQGLNMFDASGRLVLTNQHYIDMYGLSSDVVKPGCPIRRLVEHRIERGSFFAIDPEGYINSLVSNITERTPSRELQEIPDGRTIAVVNQPMEGGGWVVTHDDITERHRAEKDLERTRLFLTTVIENVPAIIVVKEAHSLNYVLINRAGEEYYGIGRQDMIGRSAYEVFPKAAADVITKYDRQAIDTHSPVFIDEHALVIPSREERTVTSTRLPILDQAGTAIYLVTVIQDVTERKRAEARIAHLAHHDALTGLPNRAAFNDRFAEMLAHAAATNTPFAVLCSDLDRFKEINDVFGHAVGDEFLCALTKRMQVAAEGVFLARLGGDEFALLLSDSPLPAKATKLAERLLACGTEEFEVGGQRLRTGSSVGIAMYPIDGGDAGTLLGNADAALYRAKAEGRGSIRFFEADMDKQLRERRALVQELRLAVPRDQLVLHYQPQARIDGDIIGFEALLRWRHPTRGLVPPTTFIPVAEESGLILSIGEWVLREACREAASWPKPLKIAVNLSPIQFRHGDLPRFVHAVLLETGLPASRLELEITESVLIEDFQRAIAVLRRLKALGVHIAMDDFGTGYSSLSNLQTFAFDKIKIDRSFISNLETNPHSATIVRAVIGLGRGLALPIIAEGVETERQLAFLASESCTEIQGYLLGKPRPIADYAELVGRPPAPEPHQTRRTAS